MPGESHQSVLGERRFRPSLPGERRGGRKKGTPNKADATIKEMVIKALNTAGGADYLAARALDQPVAFMGLVGRVLPLQLTGENGGALAIDFRWLDAPPTIDADATTIVSDETITVTFVDTDVGER